MIKDSAGICDVVRNLCRIECRECTPNVSLLKEDNSFCKACIAEQIKKYGTAKCSSIESYAYYQTERWGGSYEFLCPAGCAFICSIFNSNAQTALLAGPFLMVEKDDFLQNDLSALVPLSLSIKLAAEDLTYFDAKRVPFITDMLFSLCAQFSGKTTTELESLELADIGMRRAYETINQSAGRYPVYKEQQLRLYLSRGDRDNAGKILNELLGYIYFESGFDFNIIKTRITEIAVVLSRGAIDGGADIDHVLHLNNEYIHQISGLKDIHQLNYCLSHALVMYIRCVFKAKGKEYSQVVLDVMDYIRKNYSGKLSLNDIADSVFFSVSYISRIFKSETGENVSSYINKVRIEHAKAVLMGDSIPLVEVAMKCGFDDQSYFNKVFKKLCGCTPTAFRQNKGNIYKDGRKENNYE